MPRSGTTCGLWGLLYSPPPPPPPPPTCRHDARLDSRPTSSLTPFTAGLHKLWSLEFYRIVRIPVPPRHTSSFLSHLFCFTLASYEVIFGLCGLAGGDYIVLRQLGFMSLLFAMLVAGYSFSFVDVAPSSDDLNCSLRRILSP